MPVTVWRNLIAQHYPNSGWVRLSHDTVAALAGYKSAHGLLDLGHINNLRFLHQYRDWLTNQKTRPNAA